MTPPAAPDNATDQPTGFVKALTLTDATMLVAGSMIGSGIFIVSADIARTTAGSGWLILAWIVTGIMTLLGALAYGELAAMFPRAGGQYVFLREAMGPLMGFLYGWTLFLVIQTGTIAAVGVAFGRFLGVLVPAVTPDLFSWFPHATVQTPGGAAEFGLSAQRLAALGCIWLVTFVNLRGVREGKLVQTTLTTVKLVSIGALVVLGLTIGRSAPAVAANFSGSGLWGTSALGSAFVITFGSVLVGSLFSSDAWNNVTFAAAEVQDASRNLPRALLFGTLIVTTLYCLVNVAYLQALPLVGDAAGPTAFARGIQHATQDRVATAMVEQMFGGIAPALMAVAIIISAFGCTNGMILAGARVYWAMARDGLFFRSAGTINDRGVPSGALVAQAVWCSVLCLTGTYGQLLDYVIFAALVFYALTTIGLFVLRAKRPDAVRPYRAVGYPVLPALYVALSASVAVILLIADKTRAQALTGLGIVLLGLPVYAFWRQSTGAETAPPAIRST